VDKPPRPSALPVIAGNIPAELRRPQQWVCWRYTWKEDRQKWDKPPSNPHSLTAAKPNDPQTWGTFDEALGRYSAGEADGIGWVPVDDGSEEVLIGIDFDHCRDPETGKIGEWFAAWIEALDTYTELSPSGTGIRMFAWGRLPPQGRKRGPVEVYQHHHYLTVTGQHLDGSPATIEHRPKQLLDLHRHVWPEHHRDSGPNGEQPLANNLDDNELIRRMFASKYGALIRHLWDGGSDDYPSDSEADLAFCSRVGWWCQWDMGRLDRLFRLSGRMRAKWDRTDYRERTLRKACEGKSGGYEPRFKTRSTDTTAASANAQGKEGKDMILDHFRTIYAPVFRRGEVIYSQALGREVKRSEACFGADSALIEQLKKAVNVPRDKHGVDLNALPRFFSSWARTAWADLLESLPEEDGTGGEIADMAQEEFRRHVAAAFHRIVSFGSTYKVERLRNGKKETEEQTRSENRSVIDWCDLWAKPGNWSRPRSLQVWLRRDADRRLAIAFRIEFFGQIPGCPLTRYGQRRFADLARQYGVAKGGECRPGGGRALELTPEFIAELLDGPSMTHDAENSPAHARENDDSASCQEDNPCYEST
jgi:hypothetical protein